MTSEWKKAALLSHSSFGSSNSPTARKMRQALDLIRERAPDLMIDGEKHADAALAKAIRQRLVPDSPLHGSANLLVMPGLDAAHIAYNLLKAHMGVRLREAEALMREVLANLGRLEAEDGQ